MSSENPKWTFSIEEVVQGLDLDGLGDQDTSSQVGKPLIQAENEEIADGNWTVEDIDFEGKSMQVIRSGGVTLRYKKWTESEELSWDANIPDIFIPGQEGFRFKQLEDFLFFELPRKLDVSSKDKKESIEKFRASSVVTLSRNGEKPVEYSFLNMGKYFDFVADFMRFPDVDRPSQLVVVGKRAVGYMSRPEYHLRVRFGEFDRTDGEVSLFIPTNTSSNKPNWSEDLMKWALDTHSQHALISDAPNAVELSALVKGISATKKKMGY